MCAVDRISRHVYLKNNNLLCIMLVTSCRKRSEYLQSGYGTLERIQHRECGKLKKLE
jgi:hypothetical protein